MIYSSHQINFIGRINARGPIDSLFNVGGTRLFAERISKRTLNIILSKKYR